MPKAEENLKKVHEKFSWIGDDPPSQKAVGNLIDFLATEFTGHEIEGMALFSELKAHELHRSGNGPTLPKDPLSGWWEHTQRARLLRELLNAVLMGYTGEEYVENTTPRPV